MAQTSEPNAEPSAEALRRYYLDAMGIQLWLENTPVTEEADLVQADAVAQTGSVSSTADDSEAWRSLQAQVASCTRCALHGSRTRTVFGVGNVHADVLVIGEAPGQEEDAQGEPFVGRAGKLLDAMLLAIGLQREQVYIANILKCRPPGNRDPLAEEVAMCSGYLQQQIAMLQPKLIFAVGKVAAHNLLAIDDTLGAMRGKTYDYLGIPLIVSYHPAYLLRKPTEKRKAWQDLQRLRAMLD